MITKKINVWLASQDNSLAIKISKLIKTALECEFIVFLEIPKPEDVRNSIPTASVLLVDNNLIDWQVQLDQFKKNFPGVEIIILELLEGNQVWHSYQSSDNIINLPFWSGQENTLIETLHLILEKLSKNSALLDLANTASQISKAKTIVEVMEATCRAIVDLFGVDHSGFVQFDDDQNHGWAMAEYPIIGSTGNRIVVEGIPAEEQVVKEGKWFVSSDVRSDENLGKVRNHLVGKGINSILIIPVRVGKTVTASFSLDAIDRKIEFSEETIKICLTFSDQVGIAIKNIRRNEEIKYLRQAFDAIQQITNRSVEGKYQETLQAIVELACKNLEVHVSTLYTYDQISDRFVIGVGFGHSEGAMVQLNKITSDSTLYRLLQCESFEKTEDAPNHPTFRGGFVEKEEILSAFGMKIMNGPVPVGVLFINFRGPKPHHFRAEEIRTYIQFGNMAAAIINNAQLQSQNKKRLFALEGLYSVGENMPEYDLENSLQRIANLALEIVGVDGNQSLGISHIAVLKGNFLDFFVASSPDVLANLKNKVGKIDISQENTKIGITGKAVLEEKTLNVGDVKADSTYCRYYIEYGSDINSQITVLLMVSGRVFGTLTVESTSRHAFNEEDKRNLEHLARYAEMVLLNSRHFTLTENLIMAGDKLTAAKRLTKVIEDIGELVRDLFGCDLVSIYTISPDNQISYPAIVSGSRLHPDSDSDPNLIKSYSRRIPLEKINPLTVLPKLLKYGKVIYCERDAIHDPILGSGDFVQRERIEAAVAIPLILKRDNYEQIIGFLFLNFLKPRSFNRQEKNEIMIFGQYLAHAIEYYRQYDELLETRGTIGGINVVTWMNDYNERWQKLAGEMATKIKSNAILIKQQLAKQVAGENVDIMDNERYIAKIKEYAEKIHKNTMPPSSHTASHYEKACRLDSVLRKIVKQYRTQKDLGVHFKISTPKEHIEIQADQEWLWHGFVNLFEYSIESMKESPSKKIEIKIAQLSNQVNVVFSDTGFRSAPCTAAVTSLSRDEKEDVFRFRLQTAKAIFALYDGNINCQESVPGHTLFKITFPVLNADTSNKSSSHHRL